MESNIYHIISKKLRGEISEKENGRLKAWLAREAGNKEIYEEMEQVWNLTGKMKPTIQSDPDAEWKKFVQMRDMNSHTVTTLHKNAYYKNVFRIAAVLIPFIAIASFFFFRVSDRAASSPWITIATADSVKNLILPDGTEVWINRNSELRYPDNFGRKERQVFINGEVFFKVAKTGKGFNVDAGQTIIRVLGTQFNINNFKGDSMAQVFVKEGKVLFAEKSRKRNNVRLTRGEKGIYEGKHVPMIKINAASDNSSSWVSHKLIFRNNSLSEVKNDIADFFSVQIRLSKELENCRFSGEFTNPELENVLEVIALSTSSTLRYEGNIIILEGNSCNN